MRKKKLREQLYSLIKGVESLFISLYKRAFPVKGDSMARFSHTEFFELSEFKHAALFNGCNYVWDALARIAPYLKSYKPGQIESDVPEGVYLVNPELITIGKGVTLEPTAYIKGPCIIGDNSTIRHGAYIRGNVIVGEDSVVGHTTEVKNSILMNKCHASHFAYIGDCILGNGVNLGAGTKCANLRLDNKPVSLTFDDAGQIQTGLRKFGAIMGDGCQTGCNSVTNPGTILGKNVYCYPCTNLSGVIQADSTVRADTSLLISLHRR